MGYRRRGGVRLGAVAVALGTLAVAGCGSLTTSGDEAGGGGGEVSLEEGFTVGLLLPESKTARYEKFDKPYFEEAMSELCPNCEVSYQNADQDATKQQAQADSMLTKGIDVMVLDAVDTAAAGAIVKKAKGQGVPVVAYDRLAEGGVDYYVSFDNVRIGEVQGKSLLKALKADGGDPKDGEVVMINGSPTDPNAAMYKKGAHSVLDGKVNIGAEYDTPEWSPDEAQTEMEQAITSLGLENIIGVYAANDGTASGAIAALKSAGVDDMPPVTGQDAELAGLQRILAGDQYMTIYKAIRPEARTAAEMAIAAATGMDYQGQQELTEVTDNGGNKIKSVLLQPVPITVDDIADTVVADGLYTVDEICTEDFAAACKEAGLTEK